jgi:hypothetical protein
MSPSSNPVDDITTEQGAADKRVESLLHQRYRGELPVPIPWNDTLDVLLSHRSTRAYLPDSLPEGTLETLVAAAQSAASSSNLHAWSVIAVEDRGLVGEGFGELARRWRPILESFDAAGVDVCYEIHPGEDLHGLSGVHRRIPRADPDVSRQGCRIPSEWSHWRIRCLPALDAARRTIPVARLGPYPMKTHACSPG